jgi:hypothetical protein
MCSALEMVLPKLWGRVSVTRAQSHRVYKGEQDFSGVLKADGPLRKTRIIAAGRKRITGGDGQWVYVHT